MTGQLTVPVIDLADAENAVVDRVAAACRDWGFFQIVNHGIDAGLSQAALDSARHFFAQDIESKRSVNRTLENHWGFYDRELTKNLRDRKEIFDFGRGGTIPWPLELRNFRRDLQAYESACHGLSLRLVALAGLGLGLDRDRLSSHFAPDHSSFMRLNYYPVETELAAGEDMPEVGPLGISRHTDAGGLTVLLQDGVSGLQVYHGDSWCDVEAIDGALTINIGDMMQVWANDAYFAALHRVGASVGRSRYSIAYFLNPSYDTLVRPLTTGEQAYRDIPWREFRDLRAQGDYGDYGEEVQISDYRLG